MPHLIMICAQQALNKRSDINEYRQVYSSAKVYDYVVEASEVKKHLDAWKVTEEDPPIQTFPTHILYHMSTYFGEELFEMEMNVPANRLSGK